jgi:hypothetical protein
MMEPSTIRPAKSTRRMPASPGKQAVVTCGRSCAWIWRLPLTSAALALAERVLTTRNAP